jgi:hypothetical protein
MIAHKVDGYWITEALERKAKREDTRQEKTGYHSHVDYVFGHSWVNTTLMCLVCGRTVEQ